MKIVIEIPDAMYENAVNDLMCGNFADRINQGKVLPKNHGRLIDADDLATGVRCTICRNPNANERGCDGACQYDNWVLKSIEGLIDHAPTIIEADKEDET